jgi:hypothetical protein
VDARFTGSAAARGALLEACKATGTR